MKTKTKNLVVFALFAGTIAFSGYKLYKTYKEVKEREEIEQEVAKETFIVEAKKELAESERERKEREALWQEDLEQMQLEDEAELLAEEELEDFYNEEGLDDPIDDIEEEMEKLLYPPNSLEAKEQYINMKIAEIDSIELRDIMFRLYQDDLNIALFNDQDKDLIDTILNEKTEFFGQDSIFVNCIWMGDIVMYFAYLAEFDLDEDVESWVQLYIDNLGLTHNTSLIQINTIIGEFCTNRRATKAGFGMFGLERIDLDDIIAKNIETLGLNDLTLRSQYNMFISNFLGDL